MKSGLPSTLREQQLCGEEFWRQFWGWNQYTGQVLSHLRLCAHSDINKIRMSSTVMRGS